MKLSGSETGLRGLMKEAIGSSLAGLLGIPTPNPAVVDFDPQLPEIIGQTWPDLWVTLNRSIAPNFGSSYVSGAATWPGDGPIPADMFTAAAEVFAFDALIQNPDRTSSRPNLFTRNGSIIVFDHDVAFSFLEAILASPQPWRVSSEKYLEQHVFYRKLKGGTIELDRLRESIAGISDHTLESTIAGLPSQWQALGADRIAEHVRLMREHVEEFVDEIRRTLA